MPEKKSPSYDRLDFKQTLLEAQSHLGFQTRQEFAEFLGKSAVTLLRWMRDGMEPRFDEACEVLKKIGWHMDRARPDFDHESVLRTRLVTHQPLEDSLLVAQTPVTYGKKNRRTESPAPTPLCIGVVDGKTGSFVNTTQSPHVPAAIRKMQLGFVALEESISVAAIEGPVLYPYYAANAWLFMRPWNQLHGIREGMTVVVNVGEQERVCRMLSTGGGEHMASDLAAQGKLLPLRDQNSTIRLEVIAAVSVS